MVNRLVPAPRNERSIVMTQFIRMAENETEAVLSMETFWAERHVCSGRHGCLEKRPQEEMAVTAVCDLCMQHLRIPGKCLSNGPALPE